MFKKLFEAFTTLTGSERTDVLFEARRIFRRSTLAYHITQDIAFLTFISQAGEIRRISDDPNFDQVSVVADKLKIMGNELRYLETVQGLSERISNASKVMDADVMRQRQGDGNTEWRELVRLVLVASDSEFKHWSESEVAAARSRFDLGSMPSIDAMVSQYGYEKIDRATEELIQERIEWVKFQNELQGINSPCHVCGVTAGLTFYDFALARMLKKERDWKPSGVAVAISALTLPTLGVGVLRGPESTQSANVLRMRLVLCDSCATKRKRGSGFVASENDCLTHPWWNKVQEAGFNKFIPESEIKKWF